MQRVANSALPGSKRPRSSTQADNGSQGARYLADILSADPFRTTLEAWASGVAAAAAATGNTGWHNQTVKDKIDEVMVAFKDNQAMAEYLVTFRMQLR